jgi:two-component system, NarL family, sensor histidine kinase DegS
MVANSVREETSPWQILKSKLQTQLEQCRRELKEIALMLEQSQLEVSKLAQRNASINAHLQQVQGQFDSMPRGDIRMAYDSALDAQQRLFVMRGQVEKLQNDQNHLNRQQELITHMLEAIEGRQEQGAGPRTTSSSVETVEMIIQAQEGERRRLSRQMHDGPAQALSNYILQSEIALRLFDVDQARAREELSSMKASAMTTLKKVRDFIFELHPMMLDDLGMVPTLKRYTEAYRDQSGLDVRLTVTGVERRLEAYQEAMIFRAVQELMHNAFQHSQGSEVKVHLDMGEANVKIVVEDNGKGFDFESLMDRGGGLGIKLLRERIEMMGGFLEVQSVIGQGTRVLFQIPARSISVASY